MISGDSLVQFGEEVQVHDLHIMLLLGVREMEGKNGEHLFIFIQEFHPTLLVSTLEEVLLNQLDQILVVCFDDAKVFIVRAVL